MNQDPEVEYVGFWERVGASLIDTIIILVLSVPLLRLIYTVSGWDDQAHIADRVEFLVSYVVPAVLVIILWMKLSATPGKMAIKATIVDARTFGKPSTMQFVIRYLGYYVASIPLGLGLIWVGLDARKQGWHDKLANTVVIRSKPRS